MKTMTFALLAAVALGACDPGAWHEDKEGCGSLQAGVSYAVRLETWGADYLYAAHVNDAADECNWSVDDDCDGWSPGGQHAVVVAPARAVDTQAGSFLAFGALEVVLDEGCVEGDAESLCIEDIAAGDRLRISGTVGLDGALHAERGSRVPGEELQIIAEVERVEKAHFVMLGLAVTYDEQSDLDGCGYSDRWYEDDWDHDWDDGWEDDWDDYGQSNGSCSSQ